MLETIRDDAKGENLGLEHYLFSIGTVSQHAWQFGDLGHPPAVIFVFVLNREIHSSF